MESKNKLPASNLIAGYIAIATAVLAVVSVAVNNGNSSEKETASSVLETSTTEVTSESSSQNDVDEIITSKSGKTTMTTSEPQTTTSKLETTKPKKKSVQTTKVTEKKYKAQAEEQEEEQEKEQVVKQDERYYPTESERILICNLVAREYGSDWVPIEEKAKIAAVVMNRVDSPQFPNNIWDVVHQPGQFEDAYTSCWDLSDTYYSYKVTDSVVQAVDFYFNNRWYFDSNIMYYYGDGTYNYFS